MRLTVQPNEPVETIGELIALLTDFVKEHPNPAEDGRPIRLHTDINGRVRKFTVSSLPSTTTH